ncbi:transcriptional regulator, LysR family [Paenibacillus curdlanolyticus YK9]|uniref:Transcriptional regulator, LysR family n=1 Tax=Paenibacillus curdlanolyticus YK9 TaxID=717606 RepID=E0I4N6_9BACL|nr:LysR family transcriptional regulator [Paenibacillus curdlanolyticus]EFM12567.1 transcriptional regulator, LysR family [Paenibacillus curdlanolyticus YK9]
MDLKELHTFQAILQEGNFSRAAAKLNYAQSTITNQIQRLEKELGIQLFKRGWDAELTASGRIFAEEVDSLMQHWNYVAEQAKALQREEIGSLSFGGLEMLAEHVLPRAIGRFAERKPLVACQLHIGNTETLTRMVLQQQLDFAICGEPAEPAALLFEPLYEERIAFIAAADHPLSERESIVFEELLRAPIIAGGSTCLYAIRLAKHFSYYAQSPLLYNISQISAIPSFVMQLSGAVGAVLESTPVPPGVKRLKVTLDDSAIAVGLLVLRNHTYASSASKLMMGLIKDELLGTNNSAT